jgi:uncharacterized protein with NRDE domain
MCLILFAHDFHPEYRLVLAANRDEFFTRPTDPLHRWADNPEILAGRDREGGGTWLGTTSGGRWAAVTNFREATAPRPDAPSRGHLVTNFLEEDSPPLEYARSLLPRAGDYNGFNLLVGDENGVVWFSNRSIPPGKPDPVGLERGVYGISNHLLDTPWPKVLRGKAGLKLILQGNGPPSSERLLELLLDTSYAAEHELPWTGVGPEMERALSAAFISTPDYGTRSSSALLIGRDGRISFAERSFDAAGRPAGEKFLTVDGPATAPH